MLATHCLSALLAAVLLASAPPASQEVRGVIRKVDLDQKELVLAARGRGMRGQTLGFQLQADTQVLVGRERGKLTDLAAGKSVRVAYEMREGRRLATVVRVAGRLGLLASRPGPADASPAAGPAVADGERVSGELRRVALTAREIVVIGPDPQGQRTRETTFQVPEDVRILKDQKPVALEDLREGETVVVSGVQREGKRVATLIQLGPGMLAVPPAPGEGRLQRLREVLKRVDGLLERLDQQRPERRP